MICWLFWAWTSIQVIGTAFWPFQQASSAVHFDCCHCSCLCFRLVSFLYQHFIQKRQWYSGEHSCLPSSWPGFDSRLTHCNFLVTVVERPLQLTIFPQSSSKNLKSFVSIFLPPPVKIRAKTNNRFCLTPFLFSPVLLIEGIFSNSGSPS